MNNSKFSSIYDCRKLLAELKEILYELKNMKSVQMKPEKGNLQFDHNFSYLLSDNIRCFNYTICELEDEIKRYEELHK